MVTALGSEAWLVSFPAAFGWEGSLAFGEVGAVLFVPALGGEGLSEGVAVVLPGLAADGAGTAAAAGGLGGCFPSAVAGDDSLPPSGRTSERSESIPRRLLLVSCETLRRNDIIDIR
jgi:hypothetical protein